MSSDDATAGTGALPLAAAAARRAGLGELRHVATTGSTNDDLADEARTGERAEVVLVADHQTAGRGRRDRRWEDRGRGSLLVSFRIEAGAESAHGAVACVAAAARDAADSIVDPTVLVKWPNDLVVESGPVPGKLAGLLSELVAGEPSVVVIGLGMNLEPVPGQPESTSVRACGAPGDRDRLLAAVIDGFASRRGDPESARAELRAHSATIGRRVRVDLGGATIEGEARQIDGGGRLVVETETGRRVIDAGDVVLLRPAGGSISD